MKMKLLLLLLSAGMLLAACGESPSPAESSVPATTSSEATVVSSSEAPSVAPSSSSSEATSEEPSIETTELTTEDTSEIETTEDTSEISSEISSEVSSEASTSEESSEPVTVAYTLTVGGVDVELTDVSASKGTEDKWREQYKGTIASAKAGDAIVFKKGTDAIYPGASGDGNNAKYDSETKGLTVITPIEEDTAIWFKVFDPEEGQTADGYDIWLEGYKKAAPSEGDELTATFSVTYETHEGQDLYMIGDFSDWKLPNAVKLTWGEGHVWSGSLKQIEGTEIEYKYIVVEEGKDWVWEGGKNHKYTFAADNLTIADSWQKS